MTAANVTFVRALVRLIFGMLQVAGATVALIFLIETGSSIFTIGSIAITGLLTIASRLLFRKERVEETHGAKRHSG